jgi:glycosyltransferase involved in cell wall biosynthesis
MRVPRELLVVMPIFNEEACLEGVLEEWSKELDASGIDYCLLVVDDGSTDRTLVLLENWKQRRGDSRIEVVSRANRGHGQTCLECYRRACLSGVPWVFQVDSDGQCDPAYFSAVWAARHDREVVYGRRAVRRDGWKRALASVLVRVVVQLSSGANCIDANVPYRLMSTARLLPLVDTVPSGFDLANIALAVQLNRAGWREAIVPIAFRPRAGGEPSVPLIRFAGKALELFGQLLLLPRPARRC